MCWILYTHSCFLLTWSKRRVHHFQLACSLLLEFMMPNKTTVKETNESPLTPLHVSAAEPKAGLQHPLTACLLKWKRVLVLQLGAATWTYFSLLICFQTTVHFFVGVFVEKIKQALLDEVINHLLSVFFTAAWSAVCNPMQLLIQCARGAQPASLHSASSLMSVQHLEVKMELKEYCVSHLETNMGTSCPYLSHAKCQFTATNN